MTDRPSLQVAILMRRERLNNRWQPWRWTLDSVVAHDDAFGTEARKLREDDAHSLWLHPGFEAALYRDEAEGYYLNVTTPAPCWFVMWRMEDAPSIDAEPIARPVMLTLSYNEAARWLDAQETVENVPAPAEVIEWMRDFAAEHYVPEPKRRKRPESFKPLQDRFGNPASVSTDKKRGGGEHG